MKATRLRVAALGWALVGAVAADAASAKGAPPPRNPLVGARPCAIERFAEASAAKLAGTEDASCIALDGGHRLCKVRSADAEHGALIFFESATERWRWPADGNLGATADFALYRAPAAGGSRSWVIANHWSSSNGLGVESSDLLFLPAFETGARPLAFTVEDFGPSAFVRLAGSEECGVLATEWFPDEDAKRGAGMYFGATLFWPTGGQLVPVADRPAVARRLLASFEDERGKDLWDGPERPWAIGDPLEWLASPRAELRANPRAKGTVTKREPGTITAVTYDDATLAPLVTVSLAAGGEVKLRERYLPPDSCGPDPATHELPIGRLGDSASGALFPQNYRPADTAALIGRAATLVTYRDPDASPSSCPPRIVWIDSTKGTP